MGETARLLLKTTLRNATGLLTIERDGVIDQRLFTVGAGTSTLEVPIKEGYGPNVYASAMLVKGRTGKGGRGVPHHPHGDDDADRRHGSQATEGGRSPPTSRATARARPVTAELKVTDGAGKPVQAEVALSAADEGVLTLIGFKTPDPLATFYAAWGLGVVDRVAIRADRPPARAGRGALRDGRRRRRRAGDVPLALPRDRVLEPAHRDRCRRAREGDVPGARQPDRVPADGRRRRRGRTVRLGRQAHDRAQAAAAAQRDAAVPERRRRSEGWRAGRQRHRQGRQRHGRRDRVTARACRGRAGAPGDRRPRERPRAGATSRCGPSAPAS